MKEMENNNIFGIEYQYRTGNSFGSHRETEILELTFNSIEVAKANLNRIKEHYQQHTEINSFDVRLGRLKIVDILEGNKNKDWFYLKEKLVAYIDSPEKYTAIDKRDEEKYIKKGYTIGSVIDVYDANSVLILYTDDGKPFQFSAPWIGYFEELLSVKLVVVDNGEINFDI
jgi:hypothetical protein